MYTLVRFGCCRGPPWMPALCPKHPPGPVSSRSVLGGTLSRPCGIHAIGLFATYMLKAPSGHGNVCDIASDSASSRVAAVFCWLFKIRGSHTSHGVRRPNNSTVVVLLPSLHAKIARQAGESISVSLCRLKDWLFEVCYPLVGGPSDPANVSGFAPNYSVVGSAFRHLY